MTHASSALPRLVAAFTLLLGVVATTAFVASVATASAGAAAVPAVQDDDDGADDGADDGNGADDGETPAAESNPAAIHAGSCAALDPQPAYPLVEFGLPQTSDEDDDDEASASGATVQGAPTAVAVQTSETEVAVSLDDLLGDAYAIGVWAGSGTTATSVACGEIGGPAAVGTTLVVGLREQNGSGYVGIAVLADEDDDDRVEVTCYLARGLAGTAAQPAPAAPGGDDDGDDDGEED